MADLRWRHSKDREQRSHTYSFYAEDSAPSHRSAWYSGKNWMPDRMECNLDDKVFPDVPTLGCSDRALKHRVKRAGIKYVITFHTSRHTFATMALTAGGDIYTTSKLLGHSNVHTTEIYTDVMMAQK